MELLFEKSTPGHGCDIFPACDVPVTSLPEALARKSALPLPELSETEISRHYTALANRAHGVNNGFYPLGSCTMKYNPRINDEMANQPGFAAVHPLQPKETVQGCTEALELLDKYLCEITGMDKMDFQPAAGAHGEFTGLLLIKKYHEAGGDTKRTKIIVPDSAHGTNPASAAMAGFTTVNVPSNADGCVDLDALRAAVDDTTAGLMLTNPNTVGLFDSNILEITNIIHEAGGLCYYDGANLNAALRAPAIWALMLCILICIKPFPLRTAAAARAQALSAAKPCLRSFCLNPHWAMVQVRDICRCARFTATSLFA